MAYTLYIGNKNYSSWSLRGWLLVRASGVAFDERVVSLNDNEHASVYKQFSPSGLVPCLVDDSTSPATVVWDSFAIAEYLAERQCTLWPADSRARAWARSISAEMHSGFRALRGEMAMCVRERIDVRPWSVGLQKDIDRVVAIWTETRRQFGRVAHDGAGKEGGGSGGRGERDGRGANGADQLLFGEFTAADAFYGPVAFRFRTYGVEPAGVAGDYLRAVLDHPYMREWEAAALGEIERVEADEPRVIYRDSIRAK
jgi:glutathione S-transferase